MATGGGGLHPSTDPWAGISTTTQWLAQRKGVTFSVLVDAIETLTEICKSKIAEIRSKQSAMSISDMFDLQMAMNQLNQFSEMSTSVIGSMNTAITSMARNLKS